MKFKIKSIAFILGFSVSLFAQNQIEQKIINESKSSSENDQQEIKANHFMCKSGNAVRTIRVEISKNNCKTIYTKEGQERTVAAYKERKGCNPVAVNIKKNLEENNWKCKDISQSRVSSSVK